MRIHTVLSVIAFGATALLSSARADEGSGIRFNLSGFANITAAKVLSGTDRTYMQWHCPCAIQNWEYVGVYELSLIHI